MKNSRNGLRKTVAFFLVGLIIILLGSVFYSVTNVRQSYFHLNEAVTEHEDWEYYIWDGDKEVKVTSDTLGRMKNTGSRTGICALRMQRTRDDIYNGSKLSFSLKKIGVEVFLGKDLLYTDFSDTKTNYQEYKKIDASEFEYLTKSPRLIDVYLPDDLSKQYLNIIFYYPPDWTYVLLEESMYPVLSSQIMDAAPLVVDIGTTAIVITFGSVIIVLICSAFLFGIREGQYHWYLMFLVLYYLTLIVKEIYDSALVIYTAIPDFLNEYFVDGVCLIPLFMFTSLWFYSGWRKKAAFIMSLFIGAVFIVDYLAADSMHVYYRSLYLGWMELAALLLFAFWLYKEYRQTTALQLKKFVVWLVPEFIFSAFMITVFEGTHIGGYSYYWKNLVYGLRAGNPKMLIELVTESLALVVTFSVIQSVYMQSVNIRKTVGFYSMRSQMALEREKNDKKIMDQLRELKHEFRHHIVTLHGLLETRQYNRALDYVETIDSNLKKLQPIQYSKNLLVDAIANSYAERMKEKNISFDHDLSLPEEIFIDDVDLSMLLTNLLENAIEACEKSKNENELYISLFMTVENDILYIIIHNFSEKSTSFDMKGNIQTSKQDQTAHGIGLKVINRIVRKYNGEMQISNLNNEFKISAFLNQNKRL